MVGLNIYIHLYMHECMVELNILYEGEKDKGPRKGSACSLVVLGSNDDLPLRRPPQLCSLPRPNQLERSALAGQQTVR